jgi:hypothetical protein
MTGNLLLFESLVALNGETLRIADEFFRPSSDAEKHTLRH